MLGRARPCDTESVKRASWLVVLVGACGDDPIHHLADAPSAAIDTPASVDAPAGAMPGAAVWARTYGTAGTLTPFAIATDAAGATLLVGEVDAGGVDFGGAGGAHAIAAGSYLAKLDASGARAWSRALTSTTTGTYAVAVATGPSDAVAIAGQYFGTANVGGGDLVSHAQSSAFVATYAADGTPRWSKSFDGNDPAAKAYALAVAFDGAGDVIVSGQFVKALDVGGTALVDAGTRDVFLAKLAGADGHTLWAQRYGDAADQSMLGIAIDPGTNAIDVYARFAGSLDLGGGALAGTGASSAIGQLDATGHHVWSKLLATAQVTGVATDAAGELVYVGTFTGDLDVAGTGAAHVLSATAATPLVVKLARDGTHVDSHAFASTATATIASVAVGAGGDVAITGAYHGAALDLSGGAHPLACSAARSFFVGAFAATGAPRWSFCLGAGASTYAEGDAVAIAPSGHVIVNGDFYQSGSGAAISLAMPAAAGGTIALPRVADADAFLARLAP